MSELQITLGPSLHSQRAKLFTWRLLGPLLYLAATMSKSVVLPLPAALHKAVGTELRARRNGRPRKHSLSGDVRAWSAMTAPLRARSVWPTIRSGIECIDRGDKFGVVALVFPQILCSTISFGHSN